jgi:hypothetical protein
MEDSGQLQTEQADFFMAALWDAARPSALEVPGYEILGEISRGGMGAVYHAKQLRPEREVALKVLLPQFAEEAEMLARFQLEARAMAALDHAGILPVYEVGEAEGMPYFSMKLAAGGTLADRLKRGPLPAKEAASLMIQLARAVHHAHQHGVLHRDLKPGNFLFMEDGRACVSDFGLAKLTVPDQGPLTRTESFFGTPHYMPPEVAAGSAADSTVAGDLYSMGAVFYECLTGSRPHPSRENVAALLRSIADDPIKPPTEILSSVPQDLSVICMKALERKPADRYATLEDFAADIERWTLGHPIHARPVGLVETAWRWAGRHPLPASLLAALVMVLVVGSTLLALSLKDARKKLHRSLIEQARAERLLGTPGHREQILALLGQAAGISQSQEIRDEAAAVLARPDLSPDGTVIPAPKPPGHADPDDPVHDWTASPDGWAWLSWHDSGKVCWWMKDLPLRVWTPAHGREIAADFLDGGQDVIVAETSLGLTSGRKTLLDTAGSPRIRFVTGSPDGKRIALARVDGLRVIQRDHPERSWHFGEAPARCAAAWSGDGSRIAITLGDRREVLLLAAETGALLTTIPATGMPEQLALDERGDLLSMSTDDGMLSLWDAADGSQWSSLPHRSRGLSFPSGAPRLRSRLADGSTVEWKIAAPLAFGYGQEAARVKADGEVSGMALSPDATRLLTISAGCVAVWSMENMRQTGVILLENQRVDDRASAWWLGNQEILLQVPGGLERVTLDADGIPGAKQRVKRMPGASVRDVRADGTWVVRVPDEDGHFVHETWPGGDADSAVLLETAPEPIDATTARHQASGRTARWEGSRIHITDPAGRSQLLTLPDHNSIASILFSADGQRILGVTRTHRVFSWDLPALAAALSHAGL